MPQRKNQLKIDAAAVQGDGAYVIMRPLTYGESKDVRRRSPHMNEEQKLAYSEDLIATHVIAWNWVNDVGEPLPLPSQNQTVLHLLTVDEIGFLSNALNGGGADPNGFSG